MLTPIWILVIGIGLLHIEDYSPVDLGNGYMIDYDETYIQKDSVRCIPYEVVEYKNDSRFIVVCQDPRSDYTQNSNANGIIYPNGTNSFYFWVVDKENDVVYGPLEYRAFTDLRRKLGFDLKLKRERWFLL